MFIALHDAVCSYSSLKFSKDFAHTLLLHSYNNHMVEELLLLPFYRCKNSFWHREGGRIRGQNDRRNLQRT